MSFELVGMAVVVVIGLWVLVAVVFWMIGRKSAEQHRPDGGVSVDKPHE